MTEGNTNTTTVSTLTSFSNFANIQQLKASPKTIQIGKRFYPFIDETYQKKITPKKLGDTPSKSSLSKRELKVLRKVSGAGSIGKITPKSDFKSTPTSIKALA